MENMSSSSTNPQDKREKQDKVWELNTEDVHLPTNKLLSSSSSSTVKKLNISIFTNSATISLILFVLSLISLIVLLALHANEKLKTPALFAIPGVLVFCAFLFVWEARWRTLIIDLENKVVICKTVGIVWAVFPFCEEEKIKFSQIVGIERNQSRFFVQNTSIPKESISIKYRDDELNQEQYYSNTNNRKNNNASSSSSSSVSMSKKVDSTSTNANNSKFEITTGLLVVKNNDNNDDDDELQQQQNQHQQKHETAIEDDGSVVLTELLELEIVAPQESRRRALGWLKWLTDECGMEELEFVK